MPTRKTLDPATLRHRIRIDEWVALADSSGNIIEDPLTGEQSRIWQPIATVWAAIEPSSVREFIQSGTTQSQIVGRITVRHRSGLRADMRLVHMVNGQEAAIYNPAGFLADKDSGLEYITIPVTAGTSIDGR